MSVTRDIVASWRTPRPVMRRLLAAGPREDRALAYLMLACAIVFVAQWPQLARAAHLDPSVPLDARIGGALMAWLFLAPLIFYAWAALARLVAGLLGGTGQGHGARLALFWSLLVVSPLWLVHGLVAGFVGKGAILTGIGGLLFVAFFYIWLSNLCEAEGFGARDAAEKG